jgi:hypothetical protein
MARNCEQYGDRAEGAFRRGWCLAAGTDRPVFVEAGDVAAFDQLAITEE